MKILVPIRYPLNEHSRRTVARALELAKDDEDSHLFVLHVNIIHEGDDTRRSDLRQAVEREFGPIDNASYHTRNAFFLEETILQEAIQQEVDCIVIGQDVRSQWIQRLEHLFDLDVDLEEFLRQQLDVRLEVVK